MIPANLHIFASSPVASPDGGIPTMPKGIDPLGALIWLALVLAIISIVLIGVCTTLL